MKVQPGEGLSNGMPSQEQHRQILLQKLQVLPAKAGQLEVLQLLVQGLGKSAPGMKRYSGLHQRRVLINQPASRAAEEEVKISRGRADLRLMPRSQEITRITRPPNPGRLVRLQ